MSKLLFCVGLPGSGKSTLAKDLVHDGGWVEVNKDDIRKSLEDGGWVWSHENEAMVIAQRDDLIYRALGDGKSVISSDTNFGRKHKVRLAEIAKEMGATFEMKYFDIPFEECLLRNQNREARVPEKVIMEMFQKYVVPDPGHFPNSAPKIEGYGEKVEYVKGLPKAIISDLDGTLSLFDGKRSPYDASKCDEDDVCWPVLEIISRFAGDDLDPYKIIYLSGREAKFREPTMQFLLNNGCPEGELFMRSTGDFRKDWIVKRELFDSNVRGKWNVEFVIDDRPQVLRMWQGIGLFTFAVGNLKEF